MLLQVLCRLILVSIFLLLQGCAAHANPGQKIVLALQARHYADAVAAVRASNVAPTERDFALGEIIIQGWTDELAVQRPRESLATGIDLLEKSAMAGHAQAISGLAALFFTGLQQESGYLLARDDALHACWKMAQEQPAKVANCIALRKKG